MKYFVFLISLMKVSTEHAISNDWDYSYLYGSQKSWPKPKLDELFSLNEEYSKIEKEITQELEAISKEKYVLNKKINETDYARSKLDKAGEKYKKLTNERLLPCCEMENF